MKSKKIRLSLFLFIILSSLTSTVFAQAGKFIQVWGGAQSTQINNRDESYYSAPQGGNSTVNLEDTYRPMGGIDYIYNFHNLFGIQTGIIYSAQGQKYSGWIDSDANPVYPGAKTRASNINFTSQVLLDYIKVPIMFRFNSGKDDGDVVDFSIYAGLQIGYLVNVSVSTNPAPPAYMSQNPPNFRKFYNSLDLDWVAGAQLNIFVTKHWGLSLGVRYDRSLGDVESKNFSYDPKAAYPAEWYYPISVKKSITPSGSDQYDRWSSKNNTVGAYLGVFIPIGE